MGFVAFLAFTNVKIKERRENLNNRLEELKKELEDLEKKNDDLKAKASQSNSREYLEKVAREQFNLKAPGEEVVVVAREKDEEKEENKEEIPEPPKKLNWWQWLKSKF